MPAGSARQVHRRLFIVLGTFINGYLKLLGHAAQRLQLISRDKGTAAGIHNKFAHIIVSGFDLQSDKENVLLYGNALTYFTNCSLNLCKLVQTHYFMPDDLDLP